MGSRAAKEALFEALASVGKALSSGRRAEIVDLLAQGERSVEDIAAELDQSVANTSHHLRNLARAGLVRTRREGTHVIYQLASEHVSQLWTVVREVATEHVAEVDRLAQAYLGREDALQPITRDELARRLRRGEVTVIDVRPPAEYEAGHVAGARSFPIQDLMRRLHALPRGGELVAYCRGPYCVFANDAVRLLQEQGFEARRLEDGFPEWKRAGLPVAVGAAPGGE